MSYWLRIGAFVAVSIVGHALFASAVTHLPERSPLRRLVAITVKLKEPPPQPEPPPEAPRPPEPRKLAEPRKLPIHEMPRKLAAAPADAPRDRVPRDAPPTERQAVVGGTNEPVFGLSMESTSAHGTGPAMPVGNTLHTKQKGPAAKPEAVKPLATPVKAYEVTKMPLPRGRCSGDYTDAAKAAGVEGTVVLDLVVGADGVPREIAVVKGLPHGLTEAAVAALQRCRFTPGERDGTPVAVRLRGFKIRFVLQSND